ncbi:MAG: HupE/UreJ family protein [Myxococcales bacterium]|nr:HupE/UreJ family protein [Myxococcales bacterium]
MRAPGSRRARGRRKRRGRARRALALALVGAALGLAPSAAAAHSVGLSQGSYRVRGAEVQVTLTFARGELRRLVPGSDRDRDGELSEGEVLAGVADLEARALAGVELALDGRPCVGALERAALTEEDGLEVTMTFACPAAGEALTITLPLLGELGPGHRHVARVIPPGSDDARIERVLGRMRPRVEVGLAPRPARPGPRSRAHPRRSPSPSPRRRAPPRRPPRVRARARARALALLRPRRRAHPDRRRSPGLPPRPGPGPRPPPRADRRDHGLHRRPLPEPLALAALGALVLEPAIVEPAIAASIIYVGVENVVLGTDREQGRWRLTLPFGFIHGLGFAGALAEVGLPAGEEAPALALVNHGVEAGQLLALALLLPLLAALDALPGLRARPWRRWLSLAIALAGALWLVERVAGSASAA